METQPSVDRSSRRQPSNRKRDVALASRAGDGDVDAFEELHHLYHRRVYAFALKRLRDPVEAEDVVQDVFLQAFRCIDRFQGRSSLLTWMFGIASHEICNRFRRRSVDTQPLDEEAGAIASVASCPARSVDAARLLSRCAEALDRHVSPSQRQVFELRYWHNRSVGSIAGSTGKSPGAIRVGLLRTRRAISESTEGLEQLLAS